MQRCLAIAILLVATGCSQGQDKPSVMGELDRLDQLTKANTALVTDMTAQMRDLSDTHERQMTERTYVAAELGYNAAKAGYSKKKLDSIIAKVLDKK